jgi:hypothetical protein
MTPVAEAGDGAVVTRSSRRQSRTAGSSSSPCTVAFWSICGSIVVLPHVVGSLLDERRGIWDVT